VTFAQKLTIETRPGPKHFRTRRIHLHVCDIPSHDPRPMMLLLRMN
jgi:hypothetical protein